MEWRVIVFDPYFSTYSKKKIVKKSVLVTGATGFLGGALARRLASLGANVTATGRNANMGNALEAVGIRFVRAELNNEVEMIALCKGQDLVFHSGALSSPWGKYQDFYDANVLGTQYIARGCLTHDVARLVHVSTPSLYFYHNDKLDVKETDVLPPKKVNHYAETKFLAEELLKKTRQEEGLRFIAIRPRAIYGVGDNAIFPRLITALRAGRLPIVGNGDNLVDLTYVENVVDALLCCAEADEAHLGKFYNITNDEPVKLWETIHFICESLNIPAPTRNVPFSRLFKIAGVLEWVFRTLPLGKEPPLTQYGVGVLGNSQTLNIEAAKRDLGYMPKITTREGIERFLQAEKEG